jgi:hypothetical protein
MKNLFHPFQKQIPIKEIFMNFDPRVRTGQ